MKSGGHIAVSSYGQTAELRSALGDMDCWDFPCGDHFSLPAGTRVMVDHAHSASHAVVVVVDDRGAEQGARVLLSNNTLRTIFRFIAENAALSQATGLEVTGVMPRVAATYGSNRRLTVLGRGSRVLGQTQSRPTVLAG